MTGPSGADNRSWLLRAVSEAVFWLLIPIWIVWVALAWRQGAEGLPAGAILTAYPESPTAYPLVLGSLAVHVAPGDAEPARGDRLIRFGDADLRGAGPMAVAARGWKSRTARSDAFEMPLTFRRGNIEHETTVRLSRNPCVRWFAVMALVEGLLAILVRLRAEGPAARSFSVAATVHAILYCGFAADSELAMRVAIIGGMLAMSLAGPLALRCVLLVPEETAPQRRWPYWAVWGAALPSLAYWQYWFGLWDPTPTTPDFRLAVVGICYAGGSVGGLALLVRNYLRAGPIGRRQLRWVLFALAIAVPALVTALVVAGLAPALIPFTLPLHLVTLLVPVSVAVAIVRFNLFDIDQLISATAAYGVILFALIAAGLVAVPLLDKMLSGELGIAPLVAQVILAVGLAAIVIPAQRMVRPWIERLFFKERFLLQKGMVHLLWALSTCPSEQAMLALVGDDLQRLLRADACVIYSGDGAVYVPVWGRGVTPPPQFKPGGPLIGALNARPGPMARDRWLRRRHGPMLSSFDRATLDTLQAEVVIPIRHATQLVAFVCLGAKRSGDIYTSTDLAMLALVAERMGAQLGRVAEKARHTTPAGTPPEAVGEIEPDAAIPHPPTAEALPEMPVFRREGDYWTIGYDGKVSRLKDSKGLQCIAYLLRHPREQFHALDLGAGAVGQGNGDSNGASNGGDAPLLDSVAKAAYKARLEQLRDELAEAEGFNDHGRIERARAEIDGLTQQLAAAVGKRIRGAVEKIRTVNPALAQHLSTSISTGYFCAYLPPDETLRSWLL
jgi:hypothetical protein